MEEGSLQTFFTLILPGRGGGCHAHFTFFIKKIAPLCGPLIQNNTKLTPPQTLGHYTQMPPLYLAFSID